MNNDIQTYQYFRTPLILVFYVSQYQNRQLNQYFFEQCRNMATIYIKPTKELWV